MKPAKSSLSTGYSIGAIELDNRGYSNTQPQLQLTVPGHADVFAFTASGTPRLELSANDPAVGVVRTTRASNAQRPTIRRGSTDRVATIALQTMLTELGFFSGPVRGDFGPLTDAAVRRFQGTAGLGVDGVVGPNTWEALDRALDDPSTVPSPPVPPPTGPRPQVNFTTSGRRVLANGVPFARLFRRGVFSIGTTPVADFIQANGHRFNDIAPSKVRVMELSSRNEGNLEAINTWDNAFLSAGIFQWTAGTGSARGELPALLDLFKGLYPDKFGELFGAYGLDVTGIRRSNTFPPTGFFTKDGTVLRRSAQKQRSLRTFEMAYCFTKAGEVDEFREAQIRHSIDRLDMVLSLPVPGHAGRTIQDFVKSEYGVALLLDQHVNRPGHVPRTLTQAINGMVGALGANPDRWSSTDEVKLLDRYLNLRARTNMTDSNQRARNIERAGASKDRGSFVA